MSDIINSLSSNSRHSIYEEMRLVHERLMDKYIIRTAAQYDSARAEIMTMYLQEFKRVSSKIAEKNSGNSSIILSLEEEAMADII